MALSVACARVLLDGRGIVARECSTCCRGCGLVGREVTAALSAAGLSLTWDGSPGSAIEVTKLEWRKRLG
ncbi:DUF6891 domain-containing protein [Streptomyces niveus]|uniref:DUF6891 domain-containing protein n=1 Tax=Streptomyces niveus TaxID=193462 RepID=UPI003443C064